ncbi:MAG: lysostaphin resistance A-like protein [cyanobacterium endosymbiont of Rhopalodia musculus]|uniref:CPBP family intramembrane glutamic endopeptidase n=1 Tax=cyanobacterium endosymbiont of Epithemia clementina EcSB TaxID=3034674 RepID=UPI00247FF778|nr:CPBP family intramembrane glutamic endopeptidase [cyanobacterium endosymbiont of Epithemia clementina EcSB]WGT67584.1 CPBP family intramembrane metalloprotease [cyanobacterium endosymbiont of Epithemia clementina EcSB]
MTNPNSSEIEPLTREQILVVMGVTAVILLIVAKVWQKVWSVTLLDIQLTPNALFGGLGVAGGIIVTSSIIYHLWPAYRQSADTYFKLVIRPLIWSDLIWLGLLPGLSEELLFRGVMLPALGLNLLAVIMSSVIFGVLHSSGAQQWPYVVWATIVGFVLGYIALATGNLAIPIVAHIITNLVSSGLWKIGKSVKIPSN